MLKTTLATLVLLCCAAGLTTSATALAPCDGVKQCKIAQCQAAKAAKVAQVTSDKRAQCAAAKAARAANVAQVKSGSVCPHAAKAAQVAQVTSDKQAQCAAAKAAQVAQIKSGKASACCTAAKAAQVAQVTSDKQAQCAAVRAARVAQIKSGNASTCCTAAKATQVAQVKSRGAFACCGACNGAKAVQTKYVAFGCTKTDAAVRKAAYSYIKAVAQMQEKIGAKGCPLEVASKTLAAVVSEEMAKYQGQATTATSNASVATTVSLGSVNGCGPDCTKACCTN